MSGSRIVVTLPLIAAGHLFGAAASTADAGWFEDATGVRTPRPIRKIAPNGVRIGRLPRGGTHGSGSSSATVTYRISDDGWVWSRETWGGYDDRGSWSNSPGPWTRKERAEIRYIDGRQYYVYAAAENSPLLVPNQQQTVPLDLAGVYRSNHGEVRMAQNGLDVEGYVTEASGGTSTFRGRIIGNTLQYSRQGANVYGSGRLTIFDGGRSLAGSGSNSRSGPYDWSMVRY